MAENLAAMITTVRDWSNRDEGQLSDSVITQCLRFAADTAYRELMIPPLERTQRYYIVGENQTHPTFTDGTLLGVISGVGGSNANTNTRRTRLTIPGDLTSFIHLRTEGRATLNAQMNAIESVDVRNDRAGLVFNEKADVRTFHDLSAEKYNANYWTRQANELLVAGFMNHGDVFELYYYRRLPALDATIPDPNTPGQTIAAPNWLLNENEKVLLFGALWQAFDYLQDPALSQSYLNKFTIAIEELNMEEKTRKASGGNVQVNFNARGLI